MSTTDGRVRAVAVFCGSRLGFDARARAAAERVGRGLAEAGIGLVYGGGRVGLMGVVADAVLAGGGSVQGVIPEFLTRREVAHPGVADLTVTGTMHERKRIMFDRADAFVALPGGLGTLDETIEVVTWRQLGLHAKPILICDVAGSARGLVGALASAVEDGFAGPDSVGLWEVLDGAEAVLARLRGLPAGPPACMARA